MFNRNKHTLSSHSSDVLRGIFFFQLIVVSQVVLIALLAMVVLFLKGFAQYFYWIVFGGAALVLLTSYLLYRKIKQNGFSALKDAVHSPAMRGRNVEVRFMGGLFSFRLDGRHGDPHALELPHNASQRQLEDPETVRIRELTELSRLLEKDLITLEEFKRSKSRLLND